MSKMQRDPNLYLMARLFGIMAEKVVERFGDEGEKVVREAVREFGESRGRAIASRVKAADKPLNVKNYFENYDMARSASYEVESRESANHAEQLFKFCPLWATWEEAGQDHVGAIYCTEIDAALARGYNPRMKFKHDHHFRDGRGDCQMSFTLEQEGQ